jgi:hypothetical protein
MVPFFFIIHPGERENSCLRSNIILACFLDCGFKSGLLHFQTSKSAPFTKIIQNISYLKAYFGQL